MSFTCPLPEDDIRNILERTREHWEQLRGKRIFITGGTGFYGRWLLESFAWANDKLSLGAHATVLSRNPGAFAKKAPHLAEHEAISLQQGDVKSFAFPMADYSHIIHAATDPSATLNADQPRSMLATILDGTRRTLDFAAASGARKLLYLSSGAVYGNIPQSLDRIEETYPGGPDPTNPKSAYGEGKRAGETMCACWGHELGIDVTVARCFATVGPGLALDGTYAIGNFINDVLNGRDIVIESDGTPVRTYIYVADLTAWLWTILLGGVKGRAYNVGSEEEISIRDTAETVRQVAGSGSKVIVKSTAAPGIAPNRYVPSTQRARTELGLAQWTTIESAIAKTFAYYARLRGVGASGGATRRAA